MFDSTKKAFRSVCGLDPTITPDQIEAAIKYLDGRANAPCEPVDEAKTRQQVADLLHIQPRAVTKLCKRGMLTPVRTTAKRVTRYTGASVRALLNGAK